MAKRVVEFVVTYDGRVLRDGVAGSVDELEKFNKAADRMRTAIEKADGGAAKMRLLQAATTDLADKMGGLDKIAGPQLEAIKKRLTSLVTAGAGVPPQFAKMAAEIERSSRLDKGRATLAAFQGQVKALKDELSGKGLREEMAVIAQYVAQMGGAAKISGAELDRLQAKLGALAAQGAKIPQGLQGLLPKVTGPVGGPGAGQKLGQAAVGQLESTGAGLASELGPAGTAMAALGPAGLAAAAGIGAVVAAGAGLIKLMADATSQAIEFGSRFQELADNSEVSSEALQAMAGTAGFGMAGVEAFAGGIKKLNTELVNSPKQFEQLGLSAEQLLAMKPEERFSAVAAAILELGTDAERTAASQALLGKSMPISTLKDFANIQEGMARSKGLGLTLDDATTAQLKALGDELGVTGQAWDALMIQFGAAIATTPGLKEAVTGVTDAIGDMAKWVGDNKEGIQEFTKEAIIPAISALKELISFLQMGADGALKFASATRGKGFVDAARGVLDLATGGTGNPVGGRGSGAGGASGLGAGAIGDGASALGGSLTNVTGGKRKWTGSEELARQAKEAEELAKAQLKWWAEVENAELKEQAAFKKVADQWRDLAGPGAAEIEAAVQAIGDSIKEHIAEGAELSVQQIGNLAKKLQELKAISPEGFAAAASSLPQDVDWERFQVMQTRGNMAGQIGGFLKPPTREIVAIKKETIDWGKALAGVADMFQVLGISADSVLGRILGGVTSVMASFQNLKKLGKDGKLFGAGGAFSTGEGGGMSTFGGKLAVGAAVGGGLASIGQLLGGGNTTAGRSLGGAAVGAQLGAVAGPWGMAAGAVVGAVIGAFKKPSWVKVGKEAGKVLGTEISKELAQQIEAVSKKLGISTKNAALLNITGAMGESGKDPRQFASQIGELMSGIASGSIPAAQGLEELGRSFTAVADAALKAGSVGDKALVGLIKQSRELGTQSPEIKAFVEQQLTQAAEGIGGWMAKLITKGADGKDLPKGIFGQGGIQLTAAGSDELDPAIAQSQATIFSAVFWATVKEKGAVGAADALRDSLAGFTELLAELGGDAATEAILGPIQRIMDLTEGNTAFRGAAEGANALKQTLEGVANAGYLTRDSFGAFETQAKAAFDQAVAGGATTAEAYQLIAPLLQSMQSASENYGIALDDGTKAMIEQAKAAGIVFATPPIDRMANAMERVVYILEEMAGLAHETADGFNDIASAADGVQLPTPGSAGTGGGAGYKAGGGDGVPGLDGPHYVAPRPGGTIARLAEKGRGEYVIPEDGLSVGGGTTITINLGDISIAIPPGSTLDPQQVAEAVNIVLRDNLSGVASNIASAKAA